MKRIFAKTTLLAAAVLALPLFASAASFGTQNFWYAPSNVIKPLPGFSTSWANASSTNFEMTLYAENYSGSDIGAQANTAYASGPSTGVHIKIPAGTYTFSTPMVFGTANKPVFLECDPAATTLIYTGTGTSTTFNSGGTNNGVYVSDYGTSGCTFIGPDWNGSTIGIQVGGSNTNEGFHMDKTSIKGYGTGLVTTTNLWIAKFTNSTIGFNGFNYFAQGGVNQGENISFTAVNFYDSLTANMASCVYGNTNGWTSVTFVNSSFDDCGVIIPPGTLNATFINPHFENPAKNSPYTYLYIATSTFTHVNISGGVFMNDATAAASSSAKGAYFIYNSGNLTLNGTTADASGSALTVTSLVNNVAGNGSVDICSFNNIHAGITNLINNVAPSGAQANTLSGCISSRLGSWPAGWNTTSGNIIQWWNGATTVQQLDANGLVKYGGQPVTIAAGAGAGSSPTISVAGSQEDAIITLTTGTTPTASAVIATSTLSVVNGTSACPTKIIPVVKPGNAAAASLYSTTSVYAVANPPTATTAFEIVAGSGPLLAATQYIWNVHIGCY